MKKKILGFLLLGTIIISSFAGCSSDNKGEDGNIETVKGGVQIIDHPLEATVDGEVRCTGAFPEIKLSDEYQKKYPKLNDRIAEQNDNWSSGTHESVEAYAVGAAEDNTKYYDNATIELKRFDDRIFSLVYRDDFMFDSDEETNWIITFNYDVATGELVKLSTVVTDEKAFAKIVREKLDEKYPKFKGTYDDYFCSDCADEDPFIYKLNNDTFNWLLTENGLALYFSDYEIASTDEEMDILISAEEIKDIIQPIYNTASTKNVDKVVTYKRAEVESFEAEDRDYLFEEPYGDGEVEDSAIANPTWKKYKSKDCKPAAEKHISLTETKKDSSDYLDTEVWATKNGFEYARMPYSDDKYRYDPVGGGEYGYEYQGINIWDKDTDEYVASFDLSLVCNGPDEESDDISSANQFINWVQVVDNTLYASIGHNGYSSEEPWSNYMVAIDMKTKKLLWRSEPNVSNFNNFKIVDDTIICGYGFTAEPDYLYLLDRFTGDKVDEIKLESAPSQFEVRDDILYVATYNTAYEFKINR